MNFMTATTSAQGTPVDDNKTQEILRAMANEYINSLKKQIESGQLKVTREINYQEAWEFHNEVFKRAGYSADAWTLNSVLSLLPESLRQIYWEQVLASAGDADAELELAARTYVFMRNKALKGAEADKKIAADWVSRIESIENTKAIVELGAFKLKEKFDHVTRAIMNALYAMPSTPSHYPAPIAPPPKTVVPLPSVSLPTPPPPRRRRRPGGGGRPPTTAGGYNNGGHYTGGGGRLIIDP